MQENRKFDPVLANAECKLVIVEHGILINRKENLLVRKDLYHVNCIFSFLSTRRCVKTL